jgi:hypothetical protein
MIHCNRGHKTCQRVRYLVIKENMIKRNDCAESVALIPQKAQKERIRLKLKLKRPGPDAGRSTG